MAEKARPIEWSRISAVLTGCAVLILASGYVAFRSRPCPDGVCPSLEQWLDRDLSVRAISVGVLAGFAFGLIDNALLWVGISSLDSLFAHFPGGGQPTVLAGYGNAFSSVISAFVSTFIGRWISDVFEVDLDRVPLWSMALGILTGSILGIAIPRMLIESLLRK